MAGAGAVHRSELLFELLAPRHGLRLSAGADETCHEGKAELLRL
jgi:hypothetical protein